MSKKSQLTVKELILNALMGNENGFMTVGQIARDVFGLQYGKFSKTTLKATVKRNIYGAIAIAASKGLVVIGKRNMAVKGRPFDQWKIAGEKDREEVILILGERRKWTKGLMESYNKILAAGENTDLLNEGDRLELNS